MNRRCAVKMTVGIGLAGTAGISIAYRSRLPLSEPTTQTLNDPKLLTIKYGTPFHNQQFRSNLMWSIKIDGKATREFKALAIPGQKHLPSMESAYRAITVESKVYGRRTHRLEDGLAELRLMYLQSYA